MEIQEKDLRRLQDIKAQPGKEIGLSIRQTKLIKDPDKATRRWLAAVSVFGSDHMVTRIFNERRQELNGMVVVTPTSVVVVEPKTTQPKVEIPNRIERSQQDFPIGCNVKIGDEKGRVVDHDENDKEMVRVDFREDSRFS